MPLMFEGKEVEVDNEGYLLDPAMWDNNVAEQLAEQLSLDMNEDRWQIVNMVREHYDVTTCVPELRTILKQLKAQSGKEKATRKHVYYLFPYGYGQMACKIAGMRKPLKILLDL